jgi:hypothetical protein
VDPTCGLMGSVKCLFFFEWTVYCGRLIEKDLVC